MPYRRLPNTDKARLRAMSNALNANNKHKINVISPANVYNLEIKLDEFKSVLSNYRNCFQEQKNYNKIYSELLHKTRLYLSHFIQIMNFAIARGEYPKKIRKFYQFESNNNSLPSLQNFEEICHWSEKIITGERNRVATGEKPFQAPSVASINTLYEQLKDSNILLHNLKLKTFNAKMKLTAIRPQIDLLIKSTWDEIEAHFENYPSLIRRDKAKTYGIVYFYRKNEEKIELKDLLNL